MVKGKYIGIDVNPDFIKYAKLKYKNDTKQFYIKDITQIRFNNKEFEKTMYIIMLHHFNRKNNIQILKELAKVTKKYIIIVDIWPSKIPERWLLQ